MTSFLVRKPAEDEVAAVATLVNAHSVAVYGEPNITAETVREWLVDPVVDLRVAETGGDLACYRDMMLAPDGTRAHLDVREHPDRPNASAAVVTSVPGLGQR